MARTFDGTDDLLTLDDGATVLTGAYTLALILKRGSDGANHTPISAYSGTTQRQYIQIASDNTIITGVSTSTFQSTTFTITNADGWVVLAVNKASGTATPRAHKYVYTSDTWTHENTDGSIADGLGSDAIKLGGLWDNSGDYYAGDIAAAGVWDRSLSDAEIERLPFTLTGWHSLDPDALWMLDQASTSQNVPDRTGGGANQSSLTGTSVATSSVPIFNYGAPIIRVASPTAVNATPTPGVVTATATLPAPALSTSSTVTPAVISATGSLPAASISTGSTISPGVISATASLPGPTVEAGAATAPPAVITSTATLPAVSISAGSTVSPGVINAATTLGAQAGAGATATPTVISASASVPSVSLSTGATPTPAAISSTASLPAPTLSTGTTATPAAISAATTVPATSLTATSAFPIGLLPLLVEINLDGTWTDITPYVQRRGSLIQIRRGRSDEAARTDPTMLSLNLNNRDGRFSPRNPTSPYYGQLTRSTQIRVSIDGDTAAVTEDFEDASLNITITDGGDAAWARFATKAHGGIWSLKSGGITHSQTSDATVTVPTDAKTLEFWRKVSSEEGFDFFRVFVDSDLVLEESGELGWSKAVVSVAGASSVLFRYVKDGSVSEGDDAAYIDDIAFQFDDRRFSGETSTLPQRWDSTGTDIWVPLEAAGIMRRLEQGSTPLRSTLFRGVTLDAPSVVAYWPCEDPSGSTVLASGLSEGAPMKITGSPDLANNSDFVASAAIPTLKDSEWVGSVPPHAATGDVQTRWLQSIPSGGAVNNEVVVAVYTTGTIRRWEVIYSTGGSGALIVKAYDGDGTTIVDDSPGSDFAVNGAKYQVSLELFEDGSDVKWNLLTLAPGSATGNQKTVQTVSSHTLGTASAVVVNPGGGLDDMAIGHVSVQTEITSLFDLGDQLGGWVEERAGERIWRLCREEGIAFSSRGSLRRGARMGVQGRATLMSLVRECEDANGGLLFEPREQVGLGFLPVHKLYNQDAAATLDYPGNELAGELQPDDDDRYTRNDITVNRAGGSSARAVQESGPLSTADPPDGVGRYDDSVSINVQADEYLPDQARWRLHLGTVDEARYRQVQVDLARSQISGTTARTEAVRRLDIGDRLVITDPPTWTGPEDVSQLTVGFAETLGNYEHQLTINNMPESPYQVAEYGADRYDTAGSVLLSGLLLPGTSDNASTPDAAALDLTGDLELRALVTLENWDSDNDLVAKWTQTGGQRSYVLAVKAGRTLLLAHSADGSATISAASDPLPANTTRLAVRATLDVDDGIGNHIVRFFTGPAIDGPWEPLGDSLVVSGATSVHSGTADLMVGSNSSGNSPATGGVEAAQVWSGIEEFGGSLAADPDFAAATAGAGSFADSQGLTWTINNSAELIGTVGSATTGLHVATQVGPRWTTDTDHFPFDVLVGGEQMRVTAITGTASPQEFTVVRSINGISKSHTSGDGVALYTTPVRAL